MKTLEEPVFRACVFVKISQDQRTYVRLTEGVMNFVYQNGKPALIKEKEMRSIRKKLDLANLGHLVNDEEQASQRKSYQVYLDNFSEWLMACMERPKLV
jgi:transcription antitermination factor NusG